MTRLNCTLNQSTNKDSIITALVSEPDQSSEDDQEEEEEESDVEDGGPNTGGLQELLRRANVELGSAIRTAEPGVDTGNGTVVLSQLSHRHAVPPSGKKRQVKANTPLDSGPTTQVL